MPQPALFISVVERRRDDRMSNALYSSFRHSGYQVRMVSEMPAVNPIIVTSLNEVLVTLVLDHTYPLDTRLDRGVPILL